MTVKLLPVLNRPILYTMAGRIVTMRKRRHNSPKTQPRGMKLSKDKYFEGNLVCKNLGAIGSGAAEGRRKTSLGDPKKL